MRVFGAVLSVFLAFAACKKNPQLVDRAAQEVAKATPAPLATPVPEPINLKSQVIVLCYHRFEDKPKKNSLAIKPAVFEAQMQALKGSGTATPWERKGAAAVAPERRSPQFHRSPSL